MLRKPTFLFLFLIGVSAIGCNLGMNESPNAATAVSPAAIAALTNTPTAAPPTAIPSPEATATVSAIVSATMPATATPSPIPPDLSIARDDVVLYPGPQLYAGDKVTFQLRPYLPDNVQPEEVTVTVLVDGKEIGEGVLNEHSLSGDAFGLIKWAWDTNNQVGQSQVRVILDKNDAILVGDENPNNNQVAFSVVVHDRQLLPEAEANAAWVTASTDCCQVHVVSGTAAYRDLPQLLEEVETAVQQAVARLDEDPQRPIDVYFIDRIIGQGGYAGSELVISYPDRNYAGIALHQVLVHETIHIIDRQFAPRRIAFLAEGLAVWASGGHYKPEDIAQQAAALLSLELALPIAELADNFYPIQHEIGYLQAASFVDFLIDRYGWSRFREFYQAVTYDDVRPPSETLNIHLQIHYNKTLAAMEADWLAHLNRLPWDETAVADLQTTLRLYNAIRRYQRLYDPAAHFLDAWLPYPNEVREVGNPADLTRRPQSETNIALELMLQAAGESLQSSDYNRANVILDSVRRVLDTNGLFQDPLAFSYQNIVRLTANNGYEAQRVVLSGDQAMIWVTDARSNTLIPLNLFLEGQEWVLID
ncbi:MAG: hypothetical protein GY803_16815 [Chloroflexi bacterium]|nr:hypothetical protein [Chloroflexota bacterium]